MHRPKETRMHSGSSSSSSSSSSSDPAPPQQHGSPIVLVPSDPPHTLPVLDYMVKRHYCRLLFCQRVDGMHLQGT